MRGVGVIIIGDEILSGKFTDENTPYLARRCRELGLDLRRVVVVPDIVDEIAAEVAAMSPRFDHIFTTGGVGPTHDDVTMRGIAQGFGVGLVRDPTLEGVLRTRLGEACNEPALRMADIPEGSELWWEGQIIWPLVVKDNVLIFPGVPSLLQKKFEGISGRFHGVPVHSARLSTLERETEIAVRLEDAQRRWPSVAIGSYPQFDPSSVTITLDSRDIDALAACLASLRSSLGLMD